LTVGLLASFAAQDRDYLAGVFSALHSELPAPTALILGPWAWSFVLPPAVLLGGGVWTGFRRPRLGTTVQAMATSVGVVLLAVVFAVARLPITAT
jgi:hypothetical protein